MSPAGRAAEASAPGPSPQAGPGPGPLRTRRGRSRERGERKQREGAGTYEKAVLAGFTWNTSVWPGCGCGCWSPLCWPWCWLCHCDQTSDGRPGNCPLLCPLSAERPDVQDTAFNSRVAAPRDQDPRQPSAPHAGERLRRAGGTRGPPRARRNRPVTGPPRTTRPGGETEAGAPCQGVQGRGGGALPGRPDRGGVLEALEPWCPGWARTELGRGRVGGPEHGRRQALHAVPLQTPRPQAALRRSLTRPEEEVTSACPELRHPHRFRVTCWGHTWPSTRSFHRCPEPRPLLLPPRVS